MIADVVVGLQYGDEGKGKVTHHLCKTGGTHMSYGSMAVAMLGTLFFMKVGSLLLTTFQRVFSLGLKVLLGTVVFLILYNFSESWMSLSQVESTLRGLFMWLKTVM